MRVSFFVALIALGAACHPPSLRERAARLGAKAGKLGTKVVAVVRPTVQVAAPSPDVRAIAHQVVADQVAQRLPSEPIVVRRSVHHDGHHAAAAADRDDAPPAHGRQPQVVVHRVNAARPIRFVLRAQTQAGKPHCEAFDTLDACQQQCTALQRPTMFRAAGPDDYTGCSCLEQDGGC